MGKLPRICYVLGGEKTPLQIGEIFQVEEYQGVRFRINENGIMNDSGGYTSTSAIYDVLNHPEKIIRRPQFSEDEKALMRLFVKAGYPLFLSAVSGEIVAWSKDGIHGNAIPKGILSQITDRLDAAAYLESEESK